MPKLIIEVGVLLESPAQQLKPKAQLSLSPQLSSKLSNEAQVRLSSVGHYRLPIQSNAKGGDRNDTLGVIVVTGFNAASQQTLLLSPAPHPIQC